MALDATRAAVLFIDFQRDVCAEGGRMVSQDAEVLARFLATRQAAGALLNRLRAQAQPRHVFIEHIYAPGYPELDGVRHVGMDEYVIAQGAFERGSAGAAWVPELTPQPGEVVFSKSTISAFADPGLDRWLRRRGIDHVAISGVVTHYAVLAASLAAVDLGYRVSVLKDCCAAADPARHETALGILGPLAEVITAAAFLGE